MLKFTNQLSDEFRRASSLSSLKAYQLSKSCKKQYLTHDYHRRNNLSYHPNIEVHHKLQHYHEQQRYTPNFMAFSKSNGHHRSVPHKNQYNSYQKSKNATNQKPQNWSTPKRMASEINTYMTKKLSTDNTANTKVSIPNENSSLRKMAAIIEPQYCLTEVNHNDIRILNQKSASLKSTQKGFSTGSKQNDNTVRKFEKISQKNEYATKMRISSINSLQNIQKRIQATLGYHRQLKV